MTARNGPGDSRGGLLTTDRPTAENPNPGEKFTPKDTRRYRQDALRRAQDDDALHLYVTAALVMAGSGRARWLLLYACPFCGGAQHVAHARLLTDVVRRRASCGHGWLLLHPIATTGKRSA